LKSHGLDPISHQSCDYSIRHRAFAIRGSLEVSRFSSCFWVIGL